jgi:hypothetical protein
MADGIVTARWMGLVTFIGLSVHAFGPVIARWLRARCPKPL